MINTATLHPMIVHFPIALIITGFLFASLEMFFSKCRRTPCTIKATYWLLTLGALSALASVLSGALFTTMHSSIFFPTHQMMAFTTAAVACAASALYILYIFKAPQSKVLHMVAYALYLVAVVCVAITGHYGGLMVY